MKRTPAKITISLLATLPVPDSLREVKSTLVYRHTFGDRDGLLALPRSTRQVGIRLEVRIDSRGDHARYSWFMVQAYSIAPLVR